MSGMTHSILERRTTPAGPSPRSPLAFYDAIALFDADNLVHPEFLARMNDYLEAHEDAEVIQGYLETKNPDHSWLTRMYALAYWYANRFWQLARANWGLSATLGGTGPIYGRPVLPVWVEPEKPH